MTKHVLKTIKLITLTGLLAGATGCKHFCLENKSAGVPIILCQPNPQEITQTANDCPQSATFRVEVLPKKNLRFAWFKIDATKPGSPSVLQTNKTGYLTSSLQIENASTNDNGLYYCEIAHETDGELGDVFTRTRLAQLTVYPSLRIMSSTQLSSNPLQSVGEATNACFTGRFSASLPFSKDNMGQKFMPQGATSCELKVTQIGSSSPLTTGEFGVRWTTLTPKRDTGCTDPISLDPNKRSFTVKHPNDAHYFVVYLKPSNPPQIGTQFELTVEWK